MNVPLSLLSPTTLFFYFLAQNLAKTMGKGKGAAKELKQKEVQLQAKQEQELTELQAAWEKFRLFEAALEETDGSPEAAAAKLAADAEAAAKAAAAAAQGNEEKQGGPSKAQKRKEQRKAREAEHARRVAQDADKMPDLKKKENEALQTQLSAIKRGVKDIMADGHCLFRSIADQLNLLGVAPPQVSSSSASASSSSSGSAENKTSESTSSSSSTGAASWREMRKLAAGYILAHLDDFAPYFVDDDGNLMSTGNAARECV